MSIFDPDSFLTSAVTGANDTTMQPIPVGEYMGVIDEVKPRQTKNGGAVLDIVWRLMDSALSAELGRDKITVRQSLFLDLTPSGTLDMSKGKNIGLGRVRSATGHNDPLKPFAPNMLMGSQAKVKVTQRADKEKPDVIYNDVGAVAPAV